MIITKLAMPRRTLLRGMGVTLALPLLDAMVPALSAISKTAASPIRRFGVVYLPNGVAMNHVGINHWKPIGEGTQFEFSPILKPLEPYRDQLIVVSGTSQRKAEPLGDGNGDHIRSVASWLNGTKPKKTQGADVRAGTTVDQIAATELGKDTALPSIELGLDPKNMIGNCENGYSCAYENTLSWRNPTTPMPIEDNPRVVFERLFGEGGSTEYRLQRYQADRSILDTVMEDMARLQRKVGSRDRARTDEYFDAVREVERRIQQAEKTAAASPEGTFQLDQPPAGVPEEFADYYRLMLDMVALAYQADVTRVFTFMTGREASGRTYPEIGCTEGHHSYSHHGDRPEVLLQYAKLNTYFTEIFATGLIEKLKALPEGDGTVLDHSLILYGASLSNPNLHSHKDLPLALLGGTRDRIKGGRHIACPLDTPMTNLLLGVLDQLDIHEESLGDSSGRIELG